MFGQILIYSLITGAQVLFLTLALYLVYMVSKVVNLAQGGIATALAYTFYFSFATQHWPLFICVVVTILMAGILGFINYALNEQLTVRQQYLFAMITSFAFALSLESIIPMLFGSNAKAIIEGVTDTVTLGQYQIPLPGLFILLGGAVVALCFIFFYFYTPLGRKLRAISEHHSIAMSLGINQSRFRLAMYITAAIIAGAIGILFAMNTALTPTMGFNLVTMAFMALLVGGAGDLRGVIIASFLISVIPELIVGLAPDISASWRLPFVFLVAVIALLFKPEGLFSSRKRLS